jgi:hypothetical protein
MPKRGNCYVTSEALYHLLGGKAAGWTPRVLRLDDGTTHWFLSHKSGLVLDATAKQFGTQRVNYEMARGTGFLTKRPSAKAKVLMDTLTWQEIE